MTYRVLSRAADRCRWASLVAFIAVVAAFSFVSVPMLAADKNAATGDKHADNADKGEKAKPAKRSPAEKFLTEATVKLENFTFGDADLAAAERYAKQAKTASERLPFDLLAARYHREYENRPDRAALDVLPHLFAKNAIGDWEKTTARLRKEFKVEKPAKPDKKNNDGNVPETDAATVALAPLAPLPPANEWQLTPANAAAAVEVAVCMAAAGQMAEALAIIERVGTDFSGGNRVAAAETAGDLNFRNASYSRAVEFYDFAIGYLDHAMGTEKPESRNDDGAYAREFSEYENALRARLVRKRGDAQRKLEADQYGPDWVAYRDATRDDWERHDPASAYLEYQKIVKEWPDTVYAEAARCYAIKCLLALATGDVRPPRRPAPRSPTRREREASPSPLPPTPAEALAGAIAARERAEKRAEKLLAAAAKAKVAKPALERLRAAVERSARRTNALRGVPTGEEALKLASKNLDDFIAANRHGLYRGEALAAFVDFWLERKLDPDKGGQWLAATEKWLAEIGEADVALEKFAVPAAAQGVAAPPPSTFAKDDFGNLHFTAPGPGQVANRRAAAWYLDDLRSRLCAWQGFLAFMDGRMGKAKDLFAQYGRLNQYVRHCERNNLPNPCYRLEVRCQEGTFRRASKEELKGFQSRQRRFVAFMADFLAECEQPERAIRLYRRLLDGEFGKLAVAEEAYARFGTSWALWYYGTEYSRPEAQEEAKKVLLPFRDRKELQRTPIAARALVALGNVTGYLGDKSLERTREKAAAYWLAANTTPTTSYVEDALYYLGRIGIRNPEFRQDGLKALRRLKKEFGDGAYSNLVDEALKEIADKK